MNRHDQTSEASMEELLASIRMIISDEGQAEREERHTRRHAYAPAHSELPPQDEVLELTDDLLFAEETGPAEPEPSAPPPVEPTNAGGRSGPAHPIEERSEPPSPPRTPMNPLASQTPPESLRPRTDARVARPGTQSTLSRPVWSRRELPHGGTAPGAASSRSKPAEPERKPAPQPWREDIQIPVPAQGPVSLIGGATDTSPTPPDAAANSHPLADTGSDAARSRLEGGENVAVAELAERIARSAAGALDTSELESARSVDFQRLDDSRKAQVAATFAAAIESERQAENGAPLPTLLDEVLRQDFIREPEPQNEPEKQELQASHVEPDIEVEHTVAPALVAKTPQAQPADRPAPPALRASVASFPVAQAENAGGVVPSPQGSTSRTLEDAVREMLRPLLVEWLNEHMPRILEKAIREEIAARGVFPNRGD